jgi:magnesium-transporting ATPase (P-type)
MPDRDQVPYFACGTGTKCRILRAEQGQGVLYCRSFHPTTARQGGCGGRGNGRKTISVYARLLYQQGADTVIYDRLSEEGKAFWPQTYEHLMEFGNHGLRTLCLAYRCVR